MAFMRARCGLMSSPCFLNLSSSPFSPLTTTAISTRLHVVEPAPEPVFLAVLRGPLDLPAQPLDLLLPQPLHLVVHHDGGVLVHGHDEPFAEVAPPGEVVDDVAGDGLQPVLALDDLHLAGVPAFELLLLRVVEVLVFEDLVELVAEVLVLLEDFGHALLVEQRHGGVVVHRLPEVVLGDVVAEPRVRLPLAAEERRAGEGEVLRVGEPRPHVLGEGLVLRAVGLVHDHDDVVAVREERVRLPLVLAELLDQREDDPLVLPEKRPHLGAVLRLRRLVLLDRAGL